MTDQEAIKILQEYGSVPGGLLRQAAWKAVLRIRQIEAENAELKRQMEGQLRDLAVARATGFREGREAAQ